VWVVIAPQAGATAPAALAGTLVQSTAETLAALLLVNLVHPGHPVIFSSWPFVSDLRTGAMTGGSGEEGVLNAAAAQVAQNPRALHLAAKLLDRPFQTIAFFEPYFDHVFSNKKGPGAV